MTETETGDQLPLEEQLLEASRLSDAGEEESALELLLELDSRHPADPTLLCMVGAISAHVGAEGMAVDYFRRCLELQPTDPAILITAGSGLAASHDPAAEPALRLAALTAPDLPAARMHYGALLIRTGLLQQGLEELVAARRLDPDSSEIRRELGIAYLLASRPDEAISELEAAVAADPDDPDAKLLFALVLIQEGDVSRAGEEMYPVAAALADDPEVQVLLALTFALEGWEEEAWLALSRAEAAEAPVDPGLIAEVEEALEAGEEVVRAMLLDQIAPTALRDRIFRG